MFSWICPQCGREVPPSMTDCPDCAERAKQMAAAGPPQAAMAPPQGWPQQPLAPPPAWQQPPQQAPAPWQQPPAAWQQPPAPQAAPAWQPPPPPPPPQQAQPQWPPAPPTAYAPPQPEPPQYVPPPPQYAPPPHAQYAQQPPAAWPPPEARSGPPAWLVGVGTAVAFLLLGAGIYYFMNRSDGTSSSASAPQEKTSAATTGDTAKGKVTNPLQKYVEVVGIRMATENKQPVAKFLVVNHSGAEIVDLGANVTLLASTSRSDEDSVGTFSFKLPSLGASESKELTAPFKTKLKPYELPDWQNTTAEVQITSPTQ